MAASLAVVVVVVVLAFDAEILVVSFQVARAHQAWALLAAVALWVLMVAAG